MHELLYNYKITANKYTSSCRSGGKRATGINTSSEVMIGYVAKDGGSCGLGLYCSKSSSFEYLYLLMGNWRGGCGGPPSVAGDGIGGLDVIEFRLNHPGSKSSLSSLNVTLFSRSLLSGS